MRDKPVDFVVSTFMHQAHPFAAAILYATPNDVVKIARDLGFSIKDGARTKDLMLDYVARNLLCALSHAATIEVVYAALAAAKAPASADMIREAIQAIEDKEPTR